LQTDPRLSDHESSRRRDLVSYLGVPLIAKGDALGVLSFYTKEEHLFADDEIEFLSTLAGQAAIAIYNSRLFEQTKNQAIALEKANKVKDEFLSIMSHELRTPITVINGYARMIQERVIGEVNPEQEKVLGKILSRSGDLMGMVSGILDATRLEIQAITVERRPVRLKPFLDELRSDYNFPLEKELALRWDYSSDLPTIDTDGVKLRQVLQNLIRNAIKFTEQGEVVVSVRLRAGSRQQPIGSQPFIEIKVTDTGIGIPRESLPAIFDIFHQLDSSARRSHGGVGLGLYIVKRFTYMLGGSVEVTSDPDKGTTFTVTLPCGQ
jgi:signal transduction histidine kinase